MKRDIANKNNDPKENDHLFDFGGAIEIPEIDEDIVGILGLNENEEGEQGTNPIKTRYSIPKIYHMKESQCLYAYAEDLAKDIRIEKGTRVDCFIDGSFIFGDFIEAFIVRNNAKIPRMTITTLSMNQENVDSLHNLIAGGFVEQLNLIVSTYFYGMEFKDLIPYIYRELDIENRFQLAVCDTHTKTVTFSTTGGKRIIIHGSANLRSSANVEQITIEENEELYKFYENHTDRILEAYSTINKDNDIDDQSAIRGKTLWNVMTRVKFDD